MRRRINDDDGPTTTRPAVYGRGGDEEEDQRRLLVQDAGIDVEEGGKSLGAIQLDDWWSASFGCLCLDLTTTTKTKTTPPLSEGRCALALWEVLRGVRLAGCL